MIKGMCSQYWKLVTQGITMKEMASRMQAISSYRLKNAQKEYTAREKLTLIMRAVVTRPKVPSNIPSVI
jgi:hypothetical protein